MTQGIRWVPMRWPDEWREPERLDLLQGTAVNCVVLPWDAPPAAFLEKGRQMGLTFAAAKPIAGVKALNVLWAEKANMPWAQPADAYAFTNCEWPSLPPHDYGEGGPTGAPWVDSNGWFIRLARVRLAAKPVWIVATPAADRLRPESYELAVADAAAYGARWVLTLDTKLRAGIANGDAQALATWKRIASAARFFETHSEWDAFDPCASIAVVSDFAGSNEYLAQEILNLLPRRGAAYRIVLKNKLAQTSLAGVKGIVYPDEPPAPDAQKKQLMAFVQAGGVLLVHAKWPAPAGVAAGSDPFGRWNVYAIGRGKLAIAKDEGQDPYLVASDARLLVSNRNDVARYFNFATLNGYYLVSADAKRGVVHVLNYATRTWGHPVSIAFPRKWTSAKLWRCDAQASAPVEITSQGDGVEVHLPPFGAYAAIELTAQ